jgi:iron complex outermembrane receptor protein
LPGGLETTISYSFQEATYPATGMTPPDSPRHLAQASLSVPLIRQKLFASTDLQYVSSRITLAGQSTRAYIVPNFTLFSRHVLTGWEVSASLYNAFNQKYADPAGNGLAQDVIVQDGRGFRVKVGYRFQ